MARTLDFKTMDVLVSASERDLFQAGEKGLTKAEICRLAQNRLINGPKLSGGEKARFFNLFVERAKAGKVAGRFYHGNFVQKPRGEKEMGAKTGSGKAGKATPALHKAAEEVMGELIPATKAGKSLTKAEILSIAAKSMRLSEVPKRDRFTLFALSGAKESPKGSERYIYVSREEKLLHAAETRKRNAEAVRREEKKAAKAIAVERALPPGGEGPVHVFEAPPDIAVKVKQGPTVFEAVAGKVVVHIKK